jgi:hypothetical protein
MSLPDADRKARINLAWQQYSRAMDRSEKARQAYYAALDDERRIYIAYQDVRHPIEPAPTGGPTT